MEKRSENGECNGEHVTVMLNTCRVGFDGRSLLAVCRDVPS
jgi:hypothetical protein